jgi:hypothetical protein
VNALAHNFVQRVGGVDQAIDSSAGLRILGLEEGLPRLPDLEFAIYEKARPERRQPELLARHCTEAGLIEKAADFWGKAGQRSLARSALVEAMEQITQATDQIATLPTTPALRREQIRLQVALITPLLHVKGYAAPEPRAACG